MKPVVLGALAGALAAVLIVGGLTVSYAAKRRAQARVGWNLKPILVMAADLEEGVVLTEQALAKRDVPEQFVHGSNVSPADAEKIVGVTTGAPLLAGDPVLWSAFITRPDQAKLDACVEAIRADTDAAGEEAVTRAIDAFAQNAGGPLPDAPPLPPLPDPKDGMVRVIVAKEALKDGVVLRAEQLSVRDFPAKFATRSLVYAGNTDAVVGARLAAAMEPGDPMMWQLLDDAAHPHSPGACMARAAEAAAEARKRQAAQGAAAFAQKEGAR